MKKLLIALLLVCTAPALAAQEEQGEYESFRRLYEAEFGDYRKSEIEEYAAFRRAANAEYAEWLGREWVYMETEPGIAPPDDPKPATPPVFQHPAGAYSAVDIAAQVARVPEAGADTSEIPDILYTPQQAEGQTVVDFYAERLVLRIAKGANELIIGGFSESAVKRAWNQLASGNYDALLHDCLANKRSRQLCDWAYVQFCRQAAQSVFTSSNYNEVVLLQAFLLTQSGYNLRLAVSAGKLSILLPFDCTVYNYCFITIGGVKYYVIDGRKEGSFRVVQHGFARGRTASISIGNLPQLATRTAPAKTFGGGGRYPDMRVTLGVNRNLIDFYAQYPTSDAWDVYARASLSEATKTAIYPALRHSIQGKSKQVAADMLLDFVQHAFGYKTDQEQFGYERPLFGDESFYYPYNDCEDRSILFAILVRELLGLDVVLLDYPGHLATAVNLGASQKGDCVVVDGVRYTVCDPTYRGASVGESMPQFKNQKAKVIVL